MEMPPGLKRIKASSLSPELYDEISEFFSSVKPDLAISGRMSLHALYGHLLKAKRKKNISAKELKMAERMIRALCAAADGPRGLEFGARKQPAEERKVGRPRLANLAAQPREFQIEEKKRMLIDFASNRFFNGAAPMGLDYRSDPSVLRLDFNEIAERIGLNKMLRKAGRSMEWPKNAREMERFSEPRQMARLLESMGFRQYSRDGEQVAYGRIRDGEPYPVVLDMKPGLRYKPLAFVEIMAQAGITPAEFRAHAGALK